MTLETPFDLDWTRCFLKLAREQKGSFDPRCPLLLKERPQHL